MTTGADPAAPAAMPVREPGYCATCSTTSAADFHECSGTDCWWVNLLREDEPRRAA